MVALFQEVHMKSEIVPKVLEEISPVVASEKIARTLKRIPKPIDRVRAVNQAITAMLHEDKNSMPGIHLLRHRR